MSLKNIDNIWSNKQSTCTLQLQGVSRNDGAIWMVSKLNFHFKSCLAALLFVMNSEHSCLLPNRMVHRHSQWERVSLEQVLDPRSNPSNYTRVNHICKEKQGNEKLPSDPFCVTNPFIRWHIIMGNETAFLSCLSRFPLRVSAHNFHRVYYEAVYVFAKPWSCLQTSEYVVTASIPWATVLVSNLLVVTVSNGKHSMEAQGVQTVTF